MTSEASALKYEHKDLPFTCSELKKAVEEHETPFHIYSAKAIRDNARDFKTEFQKHFPDFRNYFAVKATPNPHIMKILKEEGMGMDCSSLAELLLCEKVGFKGEEIMFTSNDTPAHEYQKAIELGAIINIDDITHIDYLHHHFSKLPDLMCLRYNPGPLKKGNAIIGEPQEAKFGLTRDQVIQAYLLLKDAGVKRFGLHCMVASNELQKQYFGETAKLLFELAADISKQVAIKFEFINLGGGVGIPYRPGQSRIQFSELASIIHHEYKEIMEKQGLAPLRIVTECGRVVTGAYGALVTHAIHKKDTYKRYIGVDACMANLMRPGMYNSYHHISVFTPQWKHKVGSDFKSANPDETVSSNLSTYDVVGSLCENNDKFATNRVLPEIVSGDILVIHDAGAHGHSMGFNYNGKLRSAELMVMEDGSIKQIRRAETYTDLFATLDF
eukprot:TRINITY_DN3410_c1_g2_i1.p1 TRINITY_DN3410_c1_g2~~TRINITY_DN3410_c1_g2_i1.p1  ORF type:complete len:442 (+),score=129.18 TRINITY_DN3410_c1_g2_i1:45-1370(+)